MNIDWSMFASALFGGVISLIIAVAFHRKANKAIKEQTDLLIKQSKGTLDFIRFWQEGEYPFYIRRDDGTYQPAVKASYKAITNRKIKSNE